MGYQTAACLVCGEQLVYASESQPVVCSICGRENSGRVTREPWAFCQHLTSDILGKLSDIGGPRCCKRTSYVSVLTAVELINEGLGVEIPLPPDGVTCTFFRGNHECLEEKCPFFPV